MLASFVLQQQESALPCEELIVNALVQLLDRTLFMAPRGCHNVLQRIFVEFSFILVHTSTITLDETSQLPELVDLWKYRPGLAVENPFEGNKPS